MHLDLPAIDGREEILAEMGASRNESRVKPTNPTITLPRLRTLS
jgi:hypothetical protein